MSHESVTHEARRMKREYPESPLVGVGAVIVDSSDRQRPSRPADPPRTAAAAGRVVVAGRSSRMRRDSARSRVREAREETGLVVETGEMLGVYERVIRATRDGCAITMC